MIVTSSSAAPGVSLCSPLLDPLKARVVKFMLVVQFRVAS